MPRSVEEIVVVFREGEIPKAVMISNGAHTFYALKKMNREAVSQLLEVGKSNES